MDRLERELRKDAAAIRADVSPELAARIDASIRASVPAARKAVRRKAGFAWWWLSSLTGAAAVFLVVVLMNRGSEPATDTRAIADAVPPDAVSAPRASEFPAIVTAPLVEVPLNVRTAEFAEPLADELDKLKSDIEKAREKLGDDLRFTL